MPELSKQSFAACRERTTYETKIENYMVTLSRHMPGKYVHNWHCTCLEFKMSPADKRACKHTEKANNDRCQYDQFETGEKPTKGGKCPHCAGQVIYRDVAV